MSMTRAITLKMGNDSSLGLEVVRPITALKVFIYTDS